MSDNEVLKNIFDRLTEDEDIESCEDYLSRPEEFKDYVERNFHTTLTNTDMMALFDAENFVKEELQNGHDDWEKLRKEVHSKLDARSDEAA